MQKKRLEIAILADGNYPTAEYPLGLLLNADIVVCCDASVLKLKGRTPHYIVGDMDSLPQEYKETYKDIIHQSSCQDTNDQTKAFSFALILLGLLHPPVKWQSPLKGCINSFKSPGCCLGS